MTATLLQSRHMADEPETALEPTAGAPDVELAWSADDGIDTVALPRQSWRWAFGYAAALVSCAAAVAFMIAVMGWTRHGTASDRHPPPLASQSALPPPSVAAPLPSLDGTYQIVLTAEGQQYQGKAPPSSRPQGVRTIWWAFRSSCNAAGCTAVGVKLDDTDHSQVAAKWRATSDTFTFRDGRWEDGEIYVPADADMVPCPGAWDHWTIMPQADGTLTGAETDRMAAGCPSSGNSVMTPMTLTRIGPVPGGVLMP